MSLSLTKVAGDLIDDMMQQINEMQTDKHACLINDEFTGSRNKPDAHAESGSTMQCSILAQANLAPTPAARKVRLIS
jgi:hypothetical protein